MDSFLERSTTFVPVTPPRRPVSKGGIHFLMGSCFAGNLHAYLQKHFVNAVFSPFGNIYNPLSLASALKKLCSGTKVSPDEIFQHRELWRHFDFDTELCSTERELYLSLLNESLEKAGEQLLGCANLYLTLGTAYVYRRRENGQVVNNCHKLPSDRFTRDCASVEEMKAALLDALSLLRSVNRDVNIIVTLSPVRHLRDNPVENSLSKARLRCLIDELEREEGLWYFPAYEILLDQLRDYRWYAADMAHPSDRAVDYIMERFIDSAADDDFRAYLKDAEKLCRQLNHRLLHPETAEAARFRESTRLLLVDLTEKYPRMKGLKERYDRL